MAVHIADPTEYINIQSSLWKNIEEKIITKYPSNRKPIHMLPENIMQMSSLIDNNYGDIKNSITILTEINQSDYLPCNKIQLIFSKIKVKKENTFSYFEASNSISHFYELKIGLKIGQALLSKRKNKTIGAKLNDVNSSIINYYNNIPYLYINTPDEKKMKDMIGEFAIFSNSFVGEYLKINFNNFGIFRTCSASEIIHNDYYKNYTSDQLLHEIITNGIHAEYMSKVSSHDLVGSEEYTHFTSPIRRASDCICHYLLKYIHLKKNNTSLSSPFSLKELECLSTKCVHQLKNVKKIQFKDNKFRLFQIINLLLGNFKNVKLNYYIASFKKPFINIIINKINEHYVQLSYTLKIKYEINYIHNPDFIYSININYINIPGKFDEGTIPELDNNIFNIYSYF